MNLDEGNKKNRLWELRVSWKNTQFAIKWVQSETQSSQAVVENKHIKKCEKYHLTKQSFVHKQF